MTVIRGGFSRWKCFEWYFFLLKSTGCGAILRNNPCDFFSYFLNLEAVRSFPISFCPSRSHHTTLAQVADGGGSQFGSLASSAPPRCLPPSPSWPPSPLLCGHFWLHRGFFSPFQLTAPVGDGGGGSRSRATFSLLDPC